MEHLLDNQARAKVWDMIKDIRFAQLVTHADDGMMAARPMQAMNKEFDGTLWFFTQADSPKIAELQANGKVLLTYSDPQKNEYISIQGLAVVTDDRAKIAELWNEALRIWFPEGKDDPSIRLIAVKVTRAEYWDSPASTLIMIYGYAMARLTGKTPQVGDNKMVSFQEVKEAI